MLDVRLLLQFAAVAETLSFTEAARRLGMAQPRLSLQIRKLEEQLGVVLFTRSTRHVALTSHGRELFQLVRPLARLAGATLEEIERQRLGQGGRLRIGTVPLGEPSMVLASVLGQFSTANQEIEVEAEPGSIDGHYDRLLAGELDLAAITDFGAFKDLEAVRLQQLSFAAMFSDCDPLASRDALVPVDLAGRQVAMVPRRLAPDFFDTFYQPLIEAGAAPVFVPELRRSLLRDHPELVVTTIVPAPAAAALRHGICRRPIDGVSDLWLSLFRLPNRPHSRASQKFWDFARSRASARRMAVRPPVPTGA